MEPTEENGKELGDICLQEVLNIYESKRENCTIEEKRKIDTLKIGFHKICSSSQVQKILYVAQYSGQILNEAIVDRIMSIN